MSLQILRVAYCGLPHLEGDAEEDLKDFQPSDKVERA